MTKNILKINAVILLVFFSACSNNASNENGGEDEISCETPLASGEELIQKIENKGAVVRMAELNSSNTGYANAEDFKIELNNINCLMEKGEFDSLNKEGQKNLLIFTVGKNYYFTSEPDIVDGVESSDHIVVSIGGFQSHRDISALRALVRLNMKELEIYKKDHVLFYSHGIEAYAEKNNQDLKKLTQNLGAELEKIAASGVTARLGEAPQYSSIFLNEDSDYYVNEDDLNTPKTLSLKASIFSTAEQIQTLIENSLLRQEIFNSTGIKVQPMSYTRTVESLKNDTSNLGEYVMVEFEKTILQGFKETIIAQAQNIKTLGIREIEFDPKIYRTNPPSSVELSVYETSESMNIGLPPHEKLNIQKALQEFQVLLNKEVTAQKNN